MALIKSDDYWLHVNGLITAVFGSRVIAATPLYCYKLAGLFVIK